MATYYGSSQPATSSITLATVLSASRPSSSTNAARRDLTSHASSKSAVGAIGPTLSKVQHTATPTQSPPPLEEQETVTSVLSKLGEFAEAVKKGTFEEGKGSKLIIKNVSASVVAELTKHGEKGKVHAWNKWKFNFDGSALIVKRPTMVHEVMPTLLLIELHKPGQDKISISAHGTNRIVLAGQGTLMLASGHQKSPDESIYPFERDKSGFPTIVFEVGVSETDDDLEKDAVEYVGGSMGKVRLASTAKIEILDGQIKRIDWNHYEMARMQTDNEVQISSNLERHTPQRVPPEDGKPTWIYAINRPLEKKTRGSSEAAGIPYTALIITIQRTAEYKVMIDGEINPDGGCVEFTFDHMFGKDCPPHSRHDVALSIPFQAIIDAVQTRRFIQEEQKDSVKRTFSDMAGELDEVLDEARKRFRE